MIVRDFEELVGHVAEHMAHKEGYSLDSPLSPDRDKWFARAREACLLLRDMDQLRAFFPLEDTSVPDSRLE